MTEASNNLKSKNQVENTLELGDKNKEKIKNFQTFDLSYSIG